MRNRTTVIGAVVVVTAALGAGTTAAALASPAGGQPGAHAKTISGTKQPAATRAAEEQPGHDALTAAVARELSLSPARVSAALQPLYAAGHADTSSPAFVAAARSLGVSTGQLAAALVQGKESLGAGPQPSSAAGAAKAQAGSKAAEERPGHDALTAAVARELNLSPARVSAALQPLYAAGQAGTSSPAFVAAARSLGVSTGQLAAALAHGKESLAAAQ